jgi:predicted RND superfamily exporter protein
MKSFFISGFAMLEIIISLPIGIVVYSMIFGIKFVSGFHIIAIFIILGISADNFFVFKDAWEQAGTIQSLMFNDQARMAYTYRRASKTMLATTTTTGVAFLATGMSPVMPVAAFGIFASSLVFTNFFLAITWLPAIIILHHKYIRYRCCVCFKQDKNYRAKREDAIKRGGSDKPMEFSARIP